MQDEEIPPVPFLDSRVEVLDDYQSDDDPVDLEGRGGIRISLRNPGNPTMNDTECLVNGGTRACCYWVLPRGTKNKNRLYRCRVKTALVGIDMDFYRCASPTSQTAINIDTAFAEQRISPKHMRGIQFFCYHHLGDLTGLVPRQDTSPGVQTPGGPVSGPRYCLKAVRNFPRGEIIASFSHSSYVDPDSVRSMLDWPNDNYQNQSPIINTLDRRIPERRLSFGQRVIPQLRGERRIQDDTVMNYSSQCTRDLADYANDIRHKTSLDVRNQPGTDLRDPFTWEAFDFENDRQNSAIRRIRFRYFHPRLDPLRRDSYVGEPIERIALYSTRDIVASKGPDNGVDIEYDKGAEFWATLYCPTRARPTGSCTTISVANVSPVSRVVRR